MESGSGLSDVVTSIVFTYVHDDFTVAVIVNVLVVFVFIVHTFRIQLVEL